MAPLKRFKKFQTQRDSGESIEEYLLKRRKRFPSQNKAEQPILKDDESIVKEENISVQESIKDTTTTNSSTIVEEVNLPQEDGQIEEKGKEKERKKVEKFNENKQKEQPKKQEKKKAEPRLRKSLLSKLFSEERKTEK